MSTIGGLVYTQNTINTRELTTMSNAVNSKHSDKNEIWTDKTAGMFCKLLWTTPESKYEILPLHDAINQCTLSADARIDNRSELIELLNIDVNTSNPITDGELILQSYVKWGESCVTHLIGDFSFAIWDALNQKLFCARDHLGIRPFYYYHDFDRFIFATSMESIIIGAKLTKTPNCSVLKEMLENDITTYTSTVFENITRLLPAHTMRFEKGEVHIRRYWFPEKIPMNYTISLKDAASKFKSIMQQSINDRMRSISPVGCELSGGFDSSTILSLANQTHSSQKLYAFSSTYGNLPCDESSYIADIAQKLNIEPIYSQADTLDYTHYNLDYFYSINKEWPGKGSFLDAFDEFEKAKKRDIRVMLTGQGGDHITTGSKYILTDALITGHFTQLFKALTHLKWNIKIIIRYMLLPFLSKKTLSFLRYITKKELTLTPYNYGLDTEASFHSFSQKKELEGLYNPYQLQWLDSNPYIQIAEHYGIEFRHPFHDKRVVEYMLSLPGWYKYDGNITRILTREAMQDLFPHSILHRTDKAEFRSIIKQQMQSIKIPNLTIMRNYGLIKKKDLQEENIDKQWKIFCISSWFNKNFKCEEDK